MTRARAKRANEDWDQKEYFLTSEAMQNTECRVQGAGLGCRVQCMVGWVFIQVLASKVNARTLPNLFLRDERKRSKKKSQIFKMIFFPSKIVLLAVFDFFH